MAVVRFEVLSAHRPGGAGGGRLRDGGAADGAAEAEAGGVLGAQTGDERPAGSPGDVHVAMGMSI